MLKISRGIAWKETRGAWRRGCDGELHGCDIEVGDRSSRPGEHHDARNSGTSAGANGGVSAASGLGSGSFASAPEVGRSSSGGDLTGFALGVGGVGCNGRAAVC